MKKAILTVVAVLTMATSLMAQEAPRVASEAPRPELGISSGMMLGINQGHAVVGTNAMYKGIGGDFYGNNDRYGTDLRVSVSFDELINKYVYVLPAVEVITQVGIAIKKREVIPAGGAALSLKFPVVDANFKNVAVIIGYHTEQGINAGVNLGF